MPPFTVLHVCMGNICRSPMAERLLARAVAQASGLPEGKAGTLLHSHSVGTGGWHVGEPMNAPAARQLETRGADGTGFAARQLHPEHVDSADLVLCATGTQHSYVRSLRPDAGARVFVLGELGRLLAGVDLTALPHAELTPAAVYARATALVTVVDAARAGVEPGGSDDLDDPWGRGERFFARVADEIERTLRPLAAALCS